MKRLVFLVLIPLLALMLAVPVQAAELKLRYLGNANAIWQGSGFSDMPLNWTGSGFGGTILFGTNWGLRVNFDNTDVTQVTAPAGFDYSAAGGQWNAYDVGIFYKLGTVTPYVGWSYNTLRIQGPPVFDGIGYGFSRQKFNGFLIGADANIPLHGSWYATASFAYGPNQKYTYEIGEPDDFLFGADPSSDASATLTNYGLGIGYRLSVSSSLEAGWRSTGYTVNATGSAADGTNIRWDGWYVAVSLTAP